MFGAAIGAGFMVLGLLALWIRQIPQDPRCESGPIATAITWSVLLGLMGAIALGIVAPSVHSFWYVGAVLPTKPIPLIGCGIIAGGIIGGIVGLVVGSTEQR